MFSKLDRAVGLDRVGGTAKSNAFIIINGTTKNDLIIEHYKIKNNLKYGSCMYKMLKNPNVKIA